MGEVQAANNLADAYQRSRPRRTRRSICCDGALELNREVGHRYGEGVALANLGAALLDV